MSILLLSIATYLLANRINKGIYLYDGGCKSQNGEICCDVLGRHLDPNIKWYTARKASGEKWIPAYVKYVDPEKCIGCGLCLKVCIGGCYEMRDIVAKEITVSIGGKIETVKVRKQAVVANQENCYGDCHCHKICPVDGEAMICHPKTLEDSMKSDKNEG